MIKLNLFHKAVKNTAEKIRGFNLFESSLSLLGWVAFICGLNVDDVMLKTILLGVSRVLP